jgi:hypothetical protein
LYTLRKEFGSHIHSRYGLLAASEQLKQTQETLAKLLVLLESGEADKFAAPVLPVSSAISALLRATQQGQ